jgi:hypothetical protein
MAAVHFDRRGLRRTAWAMLVVWLFALTAGAVNACMLAPVGPAERAAGPVSHADIAAHEPAAGSATGTRDGSRHDRAEPVFPHGHAEDSGKVSCLKFCDDESSAIAKVKLAFVDPGSSPLTVHQPWNALVATGSAGFRPSRQRPGSRGPPLVIRFLRLTL